ncbi:hypothetical protein [Marinicrinis lubricantis]|uniref:Uncharacterized protein n=1 Tax=Marinicrinis lubricantis TaxID=2086470 RepID=A0ABW1IVR7_9BACL
MKMTGAPFFIFIGTYNFLYLLSALAGVHIMCGFDNRAVIWIV